nr:desmocollin 2-like protein [Misgurnus anguillicaudatus]
MMYRRAPCASFIVLVLFQFSESCELGPVHAFVPKRLPAGYVISKGTDELNLKRCEGVRPVAFTSSDPDFVVNTDGTIITVRDMVITTKRFYVLVQDDSGLQSKLDITLTCRDEDSQKSVAVQRRFKRKWRLLTYSISENDTPPFPKDVDTIASESAVNYTVYYVLSGPGVTTEPVGLFLLDKTTGMIRVTRAVDREQYPQFSFKAQVFDKITNQETDEFLPFNVNVEDQNDNAPEFSGSRAFTVQEHSSAGTFVGLISATDRDQAGTLHSKIKFSLFNATDWFSINGETGALSVISNTLDREAQENVYVGIEIRDMSGASNGLFSRGAAKVTLTDVNDNLPTFKEKLYKCNVTENQQNVLVLIIPVEDKDLIHTPNWRALFEVTKGNEIGNFRMETDPKTNDGLLYVVKPLDYEQTPVAKLEVTVRNEAPLVGTRASWNSVPVELSVGYEDEGPEFTPPILHVNVRENLPNGTSIGFYTALDPETKTSKGIKYYKLTDPGNWITVVENTGELKVANTVDCESPLVLNNLYNITIRAVDESKKTGNGTVIIHIQDVNDNMPLLPTSELVLCSQDDTLGSVLVEAEDKDQSPYSTPFIFNLGAVNDGKWKLKDITSSSVVLEQTAFLPNGLYSVPLMVIDLQGFGKEQNVNVHVCSCEREEHGVGICRALSASASLGSWGILILVLSGLLLLSCLLLNCMCSTKREKVYINNDIDGTGGMLLKSNTEAPGEEVKDGALMKLHSADIMDGSVNNMAVDMKNVGLSGSRYGQQSFHGGGIYNSTTQEFGTENIRSSGIFDTNLYGSSTMIRKQGSMNTFRHGTLNAWKMNKQLLDKKLAYLGDEEEGRYADDLMKVYGNEGVGSAAGSIGCCSMLEQEQDSSDFLNTLGPKFRPLADICTRPTRGGK